jgi:hypothetical protein
MTNVKVKNMLVKGQKINEWTVISRMPDNRKTRSTNLRKRVKVQCVCGTEMVLPQYYLLRKEPKKSCGCTKKGLATRNKMEYRVWYMMNVRCSNPDHIAYADYGGRGIKVCDRWHKTNPHGFANFLTDMGPRKRIRLTLDRIDVNGPYAPEFNGQRQCRWATWDEQNNNKRSDLPPPPELDTDAIEELADTDAAISASEDDESSSGIINELPSEDSEDDDGEGFDGDD